MIGRGVHRGDHESGFIRVGSVIFVLILLVLLRVYWEIDISEPAKEVFGKANVLTAGLIESAKELLGLD